MRILTDKSALLNELLALRSIFGALDTGDANIYMTALVDGLSLQATDRSSTVYGRVAAKVVEPGQVCIKGSAFLDMMKLLPNGEMILGTAKNGFLTIEFPTFTATLPAAAGSPPGELFASTATVTVTAAELTRLLGETGYILAHGAETIRTKHALLELSPDAARMVTTDGHRLACATTGAMVFEPGELETVILPRRALTHLKAILADAAGPVQIAFTDRTIRFTAGERWFQTGRVIGATFPNYTRLIQSGSLTDPIGLDVVFAGADLHAAIKRVTVLAGIEDMAVVLEVVDGEIRVEAKDTVEGDTAQDAVKAIVEGCLGRAARFKFQARYLLDVLKALGEKVQMQIGGAQSPVLFSTVGAAAAGVQAVMGQELREEKAA